MISTVPFSVLMAVHQKDDSGLFRKALESVYSNTLFPTEVVLVQDGPVTPEIACVIEEFKQKLGFNCIAQDTNRGLATALNIGLRHIATPYVFRADADDYNLPDRFAKQLALLTSGYDLVGGNIHEVDRHGRLIAIRKVPRDQKAIRRFMRKRNPFNHMTVAFRHEAVCKLGGYPDIYLKEDYALWALMIASGANVINLEDVLVNATAGPDMYRRRGGLRYVRSEIDLQAFLVRNKLQSVIGAVLTWSVRSFVFLIPAALRGMIYERFLRKTFQVQDMSSINVVRHGGNDHPHSD